MVALPVTLDALDPELRAAVAGSELPAMVDPHPLLHRLRREYRVTEAYGVVSVYRYDDVVTVLRAASSDDRHFPLYRPESVVDEPSFLHRDPPDHTRLRRAVGQRFTTRRVTRLRSFIQQRVDAAIDAIVDGELDLVPALADPLPVAVVCELLGVPVADRAFVGSWPRVQLCCSFEPGALQALADAMAPEAAVPVPDTELRDYFVALVDERGRRPCDDLVSELLGELSVAEVNATVRLLFVAGYENAANLLGPGLLALLRSPAQWAAVAAAPGLVPGAVDEAVRYCAPFPFARRVAATDLDVGGYHIERGQQIIAWIAAANRDPDHFVDPDRFDVHRTANRHLGFGSGVHACLGAPLARMQAEIVFETLTRRLVDPQPGRAAYRMDAFRCLRSLPVRAGFRPA
ncbi:MAG TPA: cytochrome P450 [Pseudonocardiaceae bacterium]|jgi:cytochrome P450|nr:cytochrome P450 [Pseudonocardiaceae bacterium]